MTILMTGGDRPLEDLDVECAECGCYDPDWEDCWKCGGAGEFDLYEEDPLFYAPGQTEICDECHGEGGWSICGNCRGLSSNGS